MDQPEFEIDPRLALRFVVRYFTREQIEWAMQVEATERVDELVRNAR